MLFDIDNIQGRDEGYLNRVHGATRTWDYLISPSPYASKAFRSAFKYEGEILETGYPRNDLFYKEDASMVADSVMEKLKIPKGKKSSYMLLHSGIIKLRKTINSFSS